MFFAMIQGVVWSKHRTRKAAEASVRRNLKKFPSYRTGETTKLRSPGYWTRSYTPAQRYWYQTKDVI